MGGADEEAPLVVEELPRLPVELHRYMRTLVQKRPDLPSMANRESMQGLMIALLESKPNPRTTLEQIGGGADPMRGGPTWHGLIICHERLIGSRAPNRVKSAERNAGTSSTSISEGSRNSCTRSCAP